MLTQTKQKTGLTTRFFPFAALFMVMLAFHLFVVYTPTDEIFYGNALTEGGFGGLLAMLGEHYHTWSARIFTEFLFSIFSAAPVLVWRLLNPIILTGSAWLLCDVLGLSRKPFASCSVCVLFFLYQWDYLSDAGWIVTTIAYLWPLFFGLVALSALMRCVRTEGVCPGLWAAGTACLILACNMEQPAIMLFLIYSIALGWMLLHKMKIHPMLWVHFALCAASLLFIFTAPGNAARTAADTAAFYPNFPMLSFLQKAEIGISGAISANVFGRDSIFFIFTLLCSLAVWEMKAPLLARLASLVAPVLLLPLSIFRYDLKEAVPQIAFFTEAYSAAGFINLSNFASPLSYLPLLVCYGIFAFCILNLITAFGPCVQNFMLIGLIALGGLSQAAIGFTPSAGVSSRRTGFFFSVCLIAACLLIWDTLERYGKRATWLRWVLYVCSAGLVLIQCKYLLELC